MSNSTNAPAVGAVIRAISGSRPISVTVDCVADDGAVTLLCGPDWTYQGGMRVTLDREKFHGSIWGRASTGSAE